MTGCKLLVMEETFHYLVVNRNISRIWREDIVTKQLVNADDIIHKKRRQHINIE